MAVGFMRSVVGDDSGARWWGGSMLWRTAIRWCGSRGGESARRPRGVWGGCASEVVRRSVGWWLRAGLPEVARRIGASGWVFRCRRLAGVAEYSRRSVMVVALPIVGWWRRAGVAEVARGFWRGIGGSLVEVARAWRTSRADRCVGRGRRAGVVETAESSAGRLLPRLASSPQCGSGRPPFSFATPPLDFSPPRPPRVRGWRGEVLETGDAAGGRPSCPTGRHLVSRPSEDPDERYRLFYEKDSCAHQDSNIASLGCTRVLSNGLYVSGRPEQPKEKAPTICSTAMPYTGGDIKKSGELGKMFELHAVKSRKSGPLSNAPSRNTSFGGATSNSGPVSNAVDRSNYSSSLSSSVPGASGSARAKSSSGPLNKHGEPAKRSSGPQSGGVTPMARQNSGPLPPMLPTTGLITSGPITSGPLNSAGAPRKVSGPLDSAASKKMRTTSFSHNQVVTKITTENSYSITGSFSKLILGAVAVLFVLGLIAGVLILGAVHNAILLIVVVVLFGSVAALFIWNSCWGRRGVIGFVDRYPDADLRTAKDGQYIKVTGVVTCGNFPLESSYQRVPRCVYTSTSLHEYRGWDSKAANARHLRFTWGLRSMEQHAVDFYISDFQSGLRALVKAGYDGERNLSSDDRIMRLKEGYIKEGSTVSVMGVVQKSDSVLMIVPPPEPISTGCQWAKCVLPRDLCGLVLRCEDTSNIDVIAV
ncbi:hypothetical protein GUJ93_ZPchr0004g38322 [Zizania palustris]|uniref:Ubiquitin-specific protease family C19-related protein n=1 Tax=Zizania palustris TaxID=103762 RepID=A0A8J5VZH1_ZIZPA|nr:hypothetical protein GUJ93_ZPchr0004g38322 [Zizania palustris]